MKILALLLVTFPLLAQPRSPEVFGQIGYGTAQGDEGSEGSGPVYGAAFHLPFAARWAFDLDVTHIRARREATSTISFGTNRTLISPAIVYRRGNERLYWFGGGGVGGRIERTFSDGPSGHFTARDSGMTIPLRTGFVMAPTGRLLIRAELFVVGSFLMPDTGVKFGVGYRF